MVLLRSCSWSGLGYVPFARRARLHEQVSRTVVYTSSLLLKTTLNHDGTVDVAWELMHLPHDHREEEASEPGLAEYVVGGLARAVAWASSAD